MNLDKVIDELNEFLTMDIREYYPIKAINILKEHLLDLNVPIKYIGRVRLAIDPSFFNDEDMANYILLNLAKSIKKVYDHVESEYGEDADAVFGDLIAGIGIDSKEE